MKPWDVVCASEIEKSVISLLVDMQTPKSLESIKTLQKMSEKGIR
jgi:hypothetical protein